MLILKWIALILLILASVPLLAQFSKRLENFLRAYDDIPVFLVIINMMTGTIGVFLGMRVGYEAGGTGWAIFGAFSAMILGLTGASYAEELID